MSAKVHASEAVETAAREVLQNEALTEAVLQFSDTRFFLSKGRRLLANAPALEQPLEYPEVPTNLKDDQDSWLK